jgi:HAD superfamily 5'-nucleotidase-like hydrolase
MSSSSSSSSSPDWIGFDLDHTLVRYRLEPLRTLTHRACQEYLTLHTGVPAEAFARAPVRELEVRGAVIDRARGNVVFLDEQLRVYSAFHGATALGAADVAGVYGDDGELAAFQFATTERFWPTHSYFETFLPGLFARLVDWLDGVNALGGGEWARFPRCRVRTYKDVTDAVHASMVHIYGSYERGLFFKEFRERTGDYLYKRPFVKRWIERVRQQSPTTRIFLVTNSMVDFTDLLCRFALDAGADWPELFDLVIFKARKPHFFTHGCPTTSLDPLVCYPVRLAPAIEIGSVPAHEMAARGSDPLNRFAHLFEGGCASQADALFRRVSGKHAVTVFYAGDHLVGDCRAAALWGGKWHPIAVTEELYELEKAERAAVVERFHLVDDAHLFVEFHDEHSATHAQTYDAERHAPHGAFFFTPDKKLTYQASILERHCELVVSDVHCLMSIRNHDALHMFRLPKPIRFRSQ